MRTCLGLHRNRTEQINELTQTLFPLPVEPAIKRCGALITSMTTGSPIRLRPSTIGMPKLVGSEPSISRKPMMSRLRLGISTPTADLPGIGATIRTWVAAKASAMLSERLTIELTLTPAAGSSSNMVTVGPRTILTNSTVTLNSCNVETSTSPRLSVVSSMTSETLG